MQILAPALPTNAALFLDFDGTLVELAATPDQIRPADGLPALLLTLVKHLDGALAIVTGRRLAEVDAHLQPLRLAGAGLHGAELRRAPHGATESSVALDLDCVAASLLAQFPQRQGFLIENKGAAIAVHYRANPAQGAAVERALRQAVEALPLDVVAGKFVFEARPRGISKGSALHQFMALAPFAGRVPVFVGDDVTDEDGFAAAQSLGGVGIKVGEGVSAATGRLRDPAAVADWLRRAVPVV